MIKQILIKDYILIDELLVNFDKGLNVITGETGAGKSIVINAVDLVFATRVSKDVIKSGRDKATIELVLDVTNKDLGELFETNGIDDFGAEVVISKEISFNSVRSRVNGTLVNQEFIRILRDKFLDIHSQNQTYAFLHPKYHIGLLDNYSKEAYGAGLDNYKSIFCDYQKVLGELEHAKSLANATESQIEFLKFQMNEIEEAQIADENEYDELKSELNILDNVEKLKELTGASYWGLNGDDGSIINALGQVKASISKASQMDDKLGTIESDLISAGEILQEISVSLRDYSQNLENDTEKLDLIQERIFYLDKIKRKYGGSLSEVMKTFGNLSNELSQIEFSTQNIEELEVKAKALLSELEKRAGEISEKRKYFAEILSDMLVEKLEKLELPRVQFKVWVEPCELNNNGRDRVEFLISTNVSEELKPLVKVASGGEISRVMLAIKAIFAKNDEIDTVIFDEIDTGVSGKTSQSVAEEISELSKFHQVILITHQPIIASKADRHFYVTKSQEGESTQVGFYVLEGENRIKALAELAGGEINEQSLDFARSLVG